MMDFDKEEEVNKHFQLISTYLEKQVRFFVFIIVKNFRFLGWIIDSNSIDDSL